MGLSWAKKFILSQHCPTPVNTMCINPQLKIVPNKLTINYCLSNVFQTPQCPDVLGGLLNCSSFLYIFFYKMYVFCRIQRAWG